MGSGMILLLVGGGVLVYGVLVYNKLISLKNRFKNAFSQIDVQLKRRYELIPNLVEVAKGAAASPDNANLVNALAGAEKQLAGAMGKFNVVMEAYPDLKADQSRSEYAGLACRTNQYR